MTRLAWDEVGQRTYEVGVDRGVLYLPDGSGDYNEAHSWSGLTTVTEQPTGAAANPHYADNIKYLNLIAAEQFGATIAAFTYPDAFAECDGTVEPSPGVLVGQQHRRLFGFAFRSALGNDSEGQDYGYKLHLIWGAQAAPTDRAYATINDQPAAIDFTWTVSTTPLPVSAAGLRATSHLVINSTKADATKLAQLEDILYGTDGTDGRLPSPDEIITLFGTGVTNVDLTAEANQPTFVEATGVLTLPAVTGVQWVVNGANVPSGARPAVAAGAAVEVVARPADDAHNLQGDTDWTFRRSA